MTPEEIARIRERMKTPFSGVEVTLKGHIHFAAMRRHLSPEQIAAVMSGVAAVINAPRVPHSGAPDGAATAEEPGAPAARETAEERK